MRYELPDSAGNDAHHLVLKLDGAEVADTMVEPGAGFVKLWDRLAVGQEYDVSLTIDDVEHTFRALCP